MSTSLAMDHPSILSDNGDSSSSNDPFLSPPSVLSGHRFSHFDKQLFALGPSTSPEQAKRALEAHLAETERRIQEASNLGTTLLQQRKDLGERLKEVEKQQSEGDITPELRQKLVDIEKEYNEVGRETARAFLPKSRVPSSEMGASPFTDKRSASPSKFESQTTAIASPSKFNVPNRKQRNQPANRVHDIEFATEISTSLLAQVRHLQALLAEKEETLKTVALEKSRLEIEAEGFTQRLRSLDESENRYKDENWNLETQIHEHLAAQKEASEREKRLMQNLSLLQAEKGATQKELDEIKLNHAKLQDQHTSEVKHLDVDLGTAKRSMTILETEKMALQKKVEELMGQNQELAQAVAHHRARIEEREASQGSGEEEPQSTTDNNTPEHSPPPSPVKMTPRHSMLESETLKSSLHHAHRMIQNLKGNIHREKTEKLELKRMLQEARDEIEVARRGEPQVDSPGPRRARKTAPIQAKKPFKVGQLGGIRNSRSEVLIEEDQEDHFEDINWEDDHEQPSPSRGSRSIGVASGAALAASIAAGVAQSPHSVFGSSTEQSDAFETANERSTETEDFQTGVEDMAGSDDTDTETEKAGTIRAKASRQSMALSKAGNRDSFLSTASTSDDEYTYEDAKTAGIHPQRLRLKVSRNGNRRPRVANEDAEADSPIELADGSKHTPQPARQSLFAELGELGSDDESVASGPPSRYASRGNTPQSSRPSTARNVPASVMPSLPRIPMIDSAMMTDPWEPEPPAQTTTVPLLSGLAGATLGAASGVAAALGFKAEHDRAVSPVPEPEAQPQAPQSAVNATNSGSLMEERQPIVSLSHSEPQAFDIAPEAEATRSVSTQEAGSVSSQYSGRPPMSEAASQWHEEQMKQQMEGLLKVQPQHDLTRPVSTTYSDMSSQYDSELIDEKLDKFPSPPVSQTDTPMTRLAVVEGAAPDVPLTMSTIRSEHIEAEPVSEVEPTPAAPLTLSSINSEQIEQVDADPAPIEPLTMSTIRSEHVEPIVEEVRPEPSVLPAILPSTPQHSSRPDYFSVSPGLGFSAIKSVDTEPIAPSTPRSPKRDGVLLSRFPAPANKSVNEDELEAKSPVAESISQDEVKPEVPKSKEEPHTPKAGFISSVFGGWNRKQTNTPIIAEDETSQSQSRSPVVETPESQRPFKVISGNTTERSPKKPRVEMADESSQTALTAEQIDDMLNKSKRQEAITTQDGPKSVLPSSPYSTNITPALKTRRSQESIGSIGRPKSKGLDIESPVDVVTGRRPTSSGSGRNASISSIHPPLPSDHKQVIAAAAQRTGSASGSGDHRHLTTLAEDQQQPLPQPQRTGSSTSAGTGTMGPPPIPSTNKNRPKTPSSQTHGSSKVISTSKYRNPSTERDVNSPSGTGRSRHSSVSSFASEVDTRFNLRAGVPMPEGVEPNTDPRMINAITQTMIGEYLWKYTRKAGRGGMSENRHRRYFWVHPYTRTLYWSDRDPSTAGRSELKAKSVAIEAVRVVTDDNPMPPGLHRKSLVILTPGRTVQFTASTGQRHETWFNALSYLLLRTGEDAVTDTVEVSGALTSEDVNEFNPGYGHAHLGSRRAPPSLSSYNSRTTRNDSPISKDRRYSTMHPRLSSRPSRPSLGSATFSRLSSYLLPGDGNRSFSVRRSRSVNGAKSIYEASEVQDSAEDLREQIERQDRESDRLENVRACCDGKHDVGHLHHEIPKGRQTMSVASGSYRQTHRASSRTSQRPSEPSQQT
ncbi:6d2f186a-f94d-43d3-bc16-ecc1343bab63 [Sclerotinia trifoliorum]|uniref:6d2f186a-f94d-43d3-bc16-ecc1343bab63 n=1 Tax=Sclerotinia trifoliorum TaxID=28548 RepID=A0A8H2VSW4_9HELO|nr:6d2f186a-f94d-43d3-bc16-ecc1343bab63 [Sclerotinia trifoliorum]